MRAKNRLVRNSLSVVRSWARAAPAVILMAAVAALVAGYANDGPGGGPHRRINALALSRFILAAAGDPILKFYDFRPTVEKYGLPAAGGFFQVKSRTVTKSGSWHKTEPLWPGVTATYIEEGDVRSPFAWWVAEGGYTADEPESYMALRHFCDPLGLGVDSENGRKAAYLTDALDPWISPLLMGHNPRMDAVSWALAESPYALIKGRDNLEYLCALAPDDKDREKEFGAAWRSLGEALHLLADMTLPAHVRNDAHPGAWIKKTLNGDPYEDYVDADTVSRCAAGPAPDAIRAEIAAAADPAALFRAVATFTNRHFFSKDTISGKDGLTGAAVHSANGQPDYPAPKLEFYAFDRAKGDAGFYETPSRGFAAAQRLNDGSHTISSPTVTGQALALIPTAVEAGVKLIDMFMPRVKVFADSLNAETSSLKFRAVRYHQDEAGPFVSDGLSVNPSSSASAIVWISAGEIRRTAIARIIAGPNDGLSVEIGDALAAIRAEAAAARSTAEATLTLGIDMGGILVKSEPLALGPLGPGIPPPAEIKKPVPPPFLDALQECRGVTVEVDGDFPQQGAVYRGSISQITGGNFNFFGRSKEKAEHPLRWNGTRFSAFYSTTRKNESPSPLNPAPTITDSVSVSGEVSADGRTISLISVLSSSNSYFNQTETIRVTGLPLQGDPFRDTVFAPSYFSESSRYVAASYVCSVSPDPRIGAGQSWTASTDQGRFNFVRVSFGR